MINLINTDQPVILCHCGTVFNATFEDNGIGAYEYWGARGTHHDWQLEADCPCCGEQDEEKFLKVLTPPEGDMGLPMEEWRLLNKQYAHEVEGLKIEGELIKVKLAFKQWCADKEAEWDLNLNMNRMFGRQYCYVEEEPYGWWMDDTREFDRMYAAKDVIILTPA